MSSPSSILVRVPNWLGDCVMALPVFAALREAHPIAHRIAACRSHLCACFTASPDVDEVVPAPPRRDWRSLLALGEEEKRLRERHIEIGLLLTNSFATALWMWRIGISRRIGYARDGRSVFLTDPIPPTPTLLVAHQSDYYLHLTTYLGADPRSRMPQLFVPEEGRRSAQKVLEERNIQGDYAVLAPVSAYGEVKDWPPRRYAEVAQALAKEMPVVLTGMTAHWEICEAIRGTSRNILNLAGAVDLAGFFGLVEGAKIFLGGDSGGAHVAAALGIPTVVIFGITEPSRTRPLGPRVRLVGRGGMATPNLKDPTVRQAARMALESISVAEVLTALHEIAID